MHLDRTFTGVLGSGSRSFFVAKCEPFVFVATDAMWIQAGISTFFLMQ
jgi:hypothetical protein